jgi:hypothetical protein
MKINNGDILLRIMMDAGAARNSCDQVYTNHRGTQVQLSMARRVWKTRMLFIFRIIVV